MEVPVQESGRRWVILRIMTKRMSNGGRRKAEGGREIVIFPSYLDLAERFAEDLKVMIYDSHLSDRSFTIALSGGNTPKMLFPVIAGHLKSQVPWEKIHIFWV